MCALSNIVAPGSAPAAALERQKLVLLTDKGRIDISAEWARTASEKAHGLMFRRSLGDRDGMLFTYGAPQEIKMWMRNTYISLDMVFIKPDGLVHRIERNAEPLSEEIIGSNGQVVAVLELRAGSADRFGLRPGNQVLHPFFSRAAAK